MEELDLKQFREGDEDAEGEETTPVDAPETTPSGPRPSFRKVLQNDSDTEKTQTQSPRPRGRPKGSVSKGKGKEVKKSKPPPPTAGRKRPISEVESEDEGEDRGANKRRDTSETDISFSLNISRANTEPPPDASNNPDDPNSDAARAIRARATLPVPVPNLTKKSRGRRVPTKTTIGEVEETQKDARLYICSVEGCGKCFHRGEHLKRHIRSIHTNEKPFKCTHAACDKFFNRHDNLLQHLKVHKDPALLPIAKQKGRDDGSMAGTSQGATLPFQVPPGFLANIPTGLFPQTGDPAVDFSTNLAIALLSTLKNTMAMQHIPGLPADLTAPFRSMAMEVSSLRTEMPGSANGGGAPTTNGHPNQPMAGPIPTQPQQFHHQQQQQQQQPMMDVQMAPPMHQQQGPPMQMQMQPIQLDFAAPVMSGSAPPVPVAVNVPVPTPDHDIDPSLPRAGPTPVSVPMAIPQTLAEQQPQVANSPPAAEPAQER
ncbi:Transcriptional regulator MNL [Salix suchowensis]|nr:Transcriptional regulator MNL [Salix suchowensis]